MPIKWTRPKAEKKVEKKSEVKAKAGGNPKPKADKPKGKKPADAKAMAGKEAK